MATGSGYILDPTHPTPSPSGSGNERRPAATRSPSRCAARPAPTSSSTTTSDRVGAGMAELGLEPGDNVALMMANSIENVETWFGLAKAGLVEVPDPHRQPRGRPRVHRRPRRRPGRWSSTRSTSPHLEAVAADLPELEHVIVNGSAEAAVELPSRLAVHELAGRASRRRAARPRPVARATPASILHSSGTTGPPKGVVLSHEAVLHLTRHLVWLMGYTADDRLFTTFPLFHNNAKYTSVTAAMECGGSLVMERALLGRRASGTLPGRRASPRSTTWAPC